MRMKNKKLGPTIDLEEERRELAMVRATDAEEERRRIPLGLYRRERRQPPLERGSR